MATITKTRIKTYLANICSNVRPLKEVEPVTDYINAKVTMVLNIDGFTVLVGVYKAEGRFRRFCYVEQTKQHYHF